MAACEAAKEAVWIQRLLSEIKNCEPKTVQIRCDNQSSISLIRNPEHHQKTKHIEVKYFLVRDQQKAGRINVTYIGTEDQLADMLTKPLPRPRLEDLRGRIGVILVEDSATYNLSLGRPLSHIGRPLECESRSRLRTHVSYNSRLPTSSGGAP